jgi:glycerol-3-phosphate O-acyltransferase
LAEAYIKHKYEPILPQKDEWPVVKLSKSRKDFVKTVAENSKKSILEITGNNMDLLKEELETTLHREKLRIKQNPWAVDPDDEKDFWRKVRSTLAQTSTDNSLTKTRRKKNTWKYWTTLP